MLRVLVADDDPLVRMLLRGRLDGVASAVGEIDIVAEADDGAGLLDSALQTRPEVVLLDLGMPDRDAIDVIGELRRLPAPPAVLVLCDFEPEERVTAARQAGAAGEVMKSARQEDLVAAIEAVVPR